mmetsp:Transcript_46919/g.62093  ORF Transcript_46919/g.62093 Transcript_46919/m.62093 type:complete len:223 (-) Transcript_46919:860-1528(-)
MPSSLTWNSLSSSAWLSAIFASGKRPFSAATRTSRRSLARRNTAMTACDCTTPSTSSKSFELRKTGSALTNWAAASAPSAIKTRRTIPTACSNSKLLRPISAPQWGRSRQRLLKSISKVVPLWKVQRQSRRLQRLRKEAHLLSKCAKKLRRLRSKEALWPRSINRSMTSLSALMMRLLHGVLSLSWYRKSRFKTRSKAEMRPKTKIMSRSRKRPNCKLTLVS